MFFNPNDYFDTPIARDFFELMCGPRLGAGVARTVYMHAGAALKTPAVIKIEHAAGRFQNVAEWQVWEAVKRIKELHQWFAPCFQISPCGNVLIQQFASDLPVDYALPARVPAFFTDLKRDNWGLINGRLVCRDYGVHLMLENGMTKRMKSTKEFNN